MSHLSFCLKKDTRGIKKKYVPSVILSFCLKKSSRQPTRTHRLKFCAFPRENNFVHYRSNFAFLRCNFAP